MHNRTWANSSISADLDSLPAHPNEIEAKEKDGHAVQVGVDNEGHSRLPTKAGMTYQTQPRKAR